MADSFDQAGQQIDQQRLALLQAIAQYGSAGRDAYGKAMSDINAQRQGEIQGALASAASRGAPQGVLDAVGGQIGSVFDRRSSDLQAGQAALGGRIAGIGANADAYGTQVKESIPALRTQYQGKLAALQAAAGQKDFANQLAMRRLQLEEQRLNKGASGSGSHFSSAFAKDVNNRAYDLAQADVMGRVTGTRTQDALAKLAGSSKNLGDALANIQASVDAGSLWSGSGKRGKDAAGHLQLDARVLADYMKQYWAKPADNYYSTAQEQVYNEGSY